jgi:hypothetical protein
MKKTLDVDSKMATATAPVKSLEASLILVSLQGGRESAEGSFFKTPVGTNSRVGTN